MKSRRLTTDIRTGCLSFREEARYLSPISHVLTFDSGVEPGNLSVGNGGRTNDLLHRNANLWRPVGGIKAIPSQDCPDLFPVFVNPAHVRSFNFCLDGPA